MAINFGSNVGVFAGPKKQIKPLPFAAYFGPLLAFALGGLADAIYLAVSHYRVYTDIGYSSFCALSKSINCDTVSQSPYSILLGVPVPVWGVLGYLVFCLLLGLAWRERRRHKDGWALLQSIALLFSLYSLVLAFISTYHVHSYCIMCIVSYGINLLLLFYTWLIRKRFRLPRVFTGLGRDLSLLWRSLASRTVCFAVLTVALLGIATFPPYWSYAEPLPIESLHAGMTEDGHPWIGALHPELEIAEYTDYLCFQCRKMHRYLRKLVARYPDRVRLVHRHFPMDHAINPLVKEPFHVGSGKMAILAIFAAEQGRFWQMNDTLFELGREREELDLRELAKRTGLDLDGMRNALADRKDLEMKLAKDIWAGMKLDINGTPAYVIHGNVYLAQIPPELFREVMR